MALKPQQLGRLRAQPLPSTGNKVAAAFELSGQTHRDAADKTGFSYVYISDVARGKYQTITVENARKFADYFDCSIEDLFPAKEGAVAS